MSTSCRVASTPESSLPVVVTYDIPDEDPMFAAINSPRHRWSSAAARDRWTPAESTKSAKEMPIAACSGKLVAICST